MLKIPRVNSTAILYFLEHVFQPCTTCMKFDTPIYGVQREIYHKKHKYGDALLKNLLKIKSFFFRFETQDSVIQC